MPEEEKSINQKYIDFWNYVEELYSTSKITQEVYELIYRKFLELRADQTEENLNKLKEYCNSVISGSSNKKPNRPPREKPRSEGSRGDDLYKKWLNIITERTQKDKDSFKNEGYKYIVPIFNTLDNLYVDHRRYEVIGNEDLQEVGKKFLELVINGQKENTDEKEKKAIIEGAEYFASTLLPEMTEYHQIRRQNMEPEPYYRWKDAFVNTVYNQYIPGSSFISREEIPEAASRVFDYFWDLFDRVENMSIMSIDEQVGIFKDNYPKDYKEGLGVHDSEYMKHEMALLGDKFVQFALNHPGISRIMNKDAKDWPTVNRTKPEERETEDEEELFQGGSDSLRTDFFNEDTQYYSGVKDTVEIPKMPEDEGYLKTNPDLLSAGVTDVNDIFNFEKFKKEHPKLGVKGSSPEARSLAMRAIVKGLMKSIKDVIIAQSIQAGVELLEAIGRQRGGQFGKVTAKIYDSYIKETIAPMFDKDFDAIFGEDIGKRVYGFIKGMVYEATGLGARGKFTDAAKYHFTLQLATQMTNRFTKRFTNKFADAVRSKLPKIIAGRLTSKASKNDRDAVQLFSTMLAQSTYTYSNNALNSLLDKKLPRAGGLFSKPGDKIRELIKNSPVKKIPMINTPIYKPPSESEISLQQLRAKPNPARLQSRNKPPVRIEESPIRVPIGNVNSFSDVFDQYATQHPIYTQVTALSRLASLAGRGKSKETQEDLNRVIASAPIAERDAIRNLLTNTFKGFRPENIPMAARARLNEIMKGTGANIPTVYEGNLLKGLARSGLSAFVYSRTKDDMANANILSTGSNAIRNGKQLGAEVGNRIIRENAKESSDIRAQRAFLTAYVEANKKGMTQADALMAGTAATAVVWGTSGNGSKDGQLELRNTIASLHELRNDKRATDLFINKFTATFSSITKGMRELGPNGYTLRVLDTITKGMAGAAIHIFNSNKKVEPVTPPKPLPFKPTKDSALQNINRRISVAHRTRKPVLTKRKSISQITEPTYLDYGITNAISMFPGGPDDFIDGVGAIAEELKEVGKKGIDKIKGFFSSPHAILMLAQLERNAPLIGTIIGGLTGLGNPISLEGGAIAGRLVGRAAGSLVGNLVGQSVKKWSPTSYRSLTPPTVTAGERTARAANAPEQLISGQTAGVRDPAVTSTPTVSAHAPARRVVKRSNKPEIDVDLFTMTDILRAVCMQIAIDDQYKGDRNAEGTPSQRFASHTPIEVGLNIANAALTAALDNPDISRFFRINLGSNISIGFTNRGLTTDIDWKGNQFSFSPQSSSVSRRLGENVAGTINLDHSGVLSAMLHHGSGFAPSVSYGFKGGDGFRFGVSYSGVPVISFGRDGITVVGGVTRGKSGGWAFDRPATLASLINLAAEVGINVYFRNHRNLVVRHFAPPAARAAARAAAIAATKQALFNAAKSGIAAITPLGWIFAAQTLFDTGVAAYKYKEAYKDKRALAHLEELEQNLNMFGGKIGKKVKKFIKEAKKFGKSDMSAYEKVLKATSLDELSEEDLAAAYDVIDSFASVAEDIRYEIEDIGEDVDKLLDGLSPSYIKRMGGREALKGSISQIKKQAKKAIKFIKQSTHDVREEEKRLRLLRDHYSDIKLAASEGYTGSLEALKKKGKKIRIERGGETEQEKEKREKKANIVDEVELEDGSTVPISQYDVENTFEFIDWDHILNSAAEDLEEDGENKKGVGEKTAFDLIEELLSESSTSREANADAAERMRAARAAARQRVLDNEEAKKVLGAVFKLAGIDNITVDDYLEARDENRRKANEAQSTNETTTPLEDEMTEEDWREQQEYEIWLEKQKAKQAIKDAERHEYLMNWAIQESPGIFEKLIEDFKTTKSYTKLMQAADRIEALGALLNQLTSVDRVDLSDEAYKKLVEKSYVALEMMNAKIDAAEKEGKGVPEAEKALRHLRETIVKKIQGEAINLYEEQVDEVMKELKAILPKFFKYRDIAYKNLRNAVIDSFRGNHGQDRDDERSTGWYGSKDVGLSRDPNHALHGVNGFYAKLFTLFDDASRRFIFDATPGPQSDKEKNTMLKTYENSKNDIMSNSVNSTSFNGYSAFNKAVDLRNRVYQIAEAIDEIKKMDDNLFEVARLAAISQGDVFEDKSGGDTIQENIALLEELYKKYSDKVALLPQDSEKFPIYSKRLQDILDQIDREAVRLEGILMRSFGSADRILGEVYNSNGAPIRGLIYSAQDMLRELAQDENFSSYGTTFSRIMNELNLGLNTVVGQVEERLHSADVYSREAFRSVNEINQEYKQKGYSRSMVHELTAISNSDIVTDTEREDANILLSQIEEHIERDVAALDLDNMPFNELRNKYRSMKTDFDNPLLHYVVEAYDRRRGETPREETREETREDTPPTSEETREEVPTGDDKGKLTYEQLVEYIRDHYDPEGKPYWEEFRSELVEKMKNVTNDSAGRVKSSDIVVELIAQNLDDRDELLRYISEYFTNANDTYEGLLRWRNEYRNKKSDQESTPQPTPEPAPSPTTAPEQPQPTTYSKPSMSTTIEYIETTNHTPAMFVTNVGSVTVNPGDRVERHTVYNAYLYDADNNRWRIANDQERDDILRQREENEVPRIILSFDNKNNSISIESPNERDGQRISIVTCDGDGCTASEIPLSSEAYSQDNNVSAILNRAILATQQGNIPVVVRRAFESAGRFNASVIMMNNAMFSTDPNDGEERDASFFERQVSEINQNIENEIFRDTVPLQDEETPPLEVEPPTGETETPIQSEETPSVDTESTVTPDATRSEEVPLNVEGEKQDDQAPPIVPDAEAIHSEEVPINVEGTREEDQAPPIVPEETVLQSEEVPLNTEETVLQSEEVPLNVEETKKDDQAPPIVPDPTVVQSEEVPLEVEHPKEGEEAPPVVPEETVLQSEEVPLEGEQTVEATRENQEEGTDAQAPEVILATDNVEGHHRQDEATRRGDKAANPARDRSANMPLGDANVNDPNQDLLEREKRKIDQAERDRIDGDARTRAKVDSDARARARARDEELVRARTRALEEALARARALEVPLVDAIPNAIPRIIPIIPIIPQGGGASPSPRPTPRTEERKPKPEEPPEIRQEPSPSPSPSQPPLERKPKEGFPPEGDVPEDSEPHVTIHDPVIYEPLPWAGKMVQSMLRDMMKEIDEDDKDFGKNLFDYEDD
jgi:hypothetical protein